MNTKNNNRICASEYSETGSAISILSNRLSILKPAEYKKPVLFLFSFPFLLDYSFLFSFFHFFNGVETQVPRRTFTRFQCVVRPPIYFKILKN